jgi:hypothetical protein
MSRKIKLEVTEVQLEAVCTLTDTISAMLGVGSDFDDLRRKVKAVDRMLKKNGYKRDFN